MMPGQQPQYQQLGSTIVSQQGGQQGRPGIGFCYHSSVWSKRNKLYLLITYPVIF
jgi:hypothetical protein